MVSPLAATVWLWGAWAISWVIAARWANRTVARPNQGAELLYRVITGMGVVLLFGLGGRLAHQDFMFWRTPPALGWCWVGLTAASFTFCWWARIHLGRLWSSSVTRKSDHHIIDTGPYALVRHPIYTGIITAAAARALCAATALPFVGFVLVVLGFWMKARLEERFLRAQLGAEAYDDYSRRTPMLFPGL